MIQAQSPMFSNDLSGLVKVLALLTTVVLLPVASLVVYFLKRSDSSKLLQFETDMNGLGSRVKAVEMEQGKLGEQMAAMQRAATADHEVVLQAINRASEVQMRAVHGVELSVARLDERNNIGDALTTFAKSIERLVEMVISRER